MLLSGTWRERWALTRDQLLTSPAFRRWAMASVFTRFIARRRARALFDLCAGFVYSQVLLAGVRLRLFELLREGPLTVAALAARLALPLDSTERLVAASSALGLLDRRSGGRFGLGALGAALVDNPGLAALIEHHAMLYADLRDPVALLRGGAGGGELAGFWPYARASEPRAASAGQVREYTALMSASQELVAGEVLAAYPLSRHRRLLDVGGGAGTFLIAAAASAPRLELVLFDLPAVAEIAQGALARAGLAARATVVGGDFFADPLPRGADIISLVRVLHDHDDERALVLLRAARDALPPGGMILIAEPLAGTPGAAIVGDAYFNFYLLAMGSGRARTRAQLAALLESAGFAPPQLLPTRVPLQTSVLVACVRVP